MDNDEVREHTLALHFLCTRDTDAAPSLMIYIFTHLIFLKIQCIGTDYPHFTNEENGAQRGYVT